MGCPELSTPRARVPSVATWRAPQAHPLHIESKVYYESNACLSKYRMCVFALHDPLLTPLEPQSRFGDKLFEVWVVCPQNGTAVLKGLIAPPCCAFHTDTERKLRRIDYRNRSVYDTFCVVEYSCDSSHHHVFIGIVSIIGFVHRYHIAYVLWLSVSYRTWFWNRYPISDNTYHTI